MTDGYWSVQFQELDGRTYLEKNRTTFKLVKSRTRKPRRRKSSSKRFHHEIPRFVEVTNERKDKDGGLHISCMPTYMYCDDCNRPPGTITTSFLFIPCGLTIRSHPIPSRTQQPVMKRTQKSGATLRVFPHWMAPPKINPKAEIGSSDNQVDPWLPHNPIMAPNLET